MFNYLRLELLASPEPPSGQIPPLSAPMLRRVLGRALIERFCPFGEPLCQAPPPAEGPVPSPLDLCRLAAECPYGVLFAASRTRRPPFALFVPPPSGGEGPAAVELTLLGPACSIYAWALWAFEEALRRGLGKERQSWSIREVWRTGLDGERERLCGPGLGGLPASLSPSSLALAGGTYIAPTPVQVVFRSPARLLRQGKLLKGREPVPFEVLIARILDRFKDLFGAAAEEILDARLRTDLEAEAARVPLRLDETEWWEVRDFSARSGAEMLLGGKVGRLVYGPEAARFFPILRAGEILHVGKNPTAGCGRIEVSLPAVT
jgi:CRISPR-associated endoribonuclease Cas6